MSFNRKDVLSYKNYLNRQVGDKMVREPITKEERLELIEKYSVLPGDWKIDSDIFKARPQATYFDSNGLYTDLTPNTGSWVSHWDLQKELCYTGLLIEDKYYITGDLYWYLNFIKIPDKVKGGEHFPMIYDMDIWFYQQIEKAELLGKFTLTLKKRQSGFSLKMLAKILKRWWFEKGFVGRIGAYEEKPLQDDWDILVKYYNHLQSTVGWKRDKTKGRLRWVQQTDLLDGTTKGNLSILQGIICSKNAAKLVGGKVDEILLEEVGIFPNVDKVIGFARAALVYGNKTTGNLHAFGAVGELKQCEPFKEYFYAPEINNFLTFDNPYTERTDNKTGIFIPVQWCYYPYIDEYGNSLIEESLEAITKQEEIEKKKSYLDYVLYKSQNPRTTEDAFANREENVFPTHIIQPHYEWLNNEYQPLLVTLIEADGSIYRKLGSKEPLVEDFPVKKHSSKVGAVVIDEMPYPNAPFGMYYAGIDTISPIQGSQSISLQSCYIYKAAHELDGEYSADKVVAWYTGRTDDPYGSYEITRKLIKFYNARCLIENNNRNYIEWLIKENEKKHIMRKYEAPISKDIIVKSNVSAQEYGINVTRLKQYLLSIVIEYITEEIGTRFDDDGTSHTIHGVERIKDKMLLKEMLDYTPKKNTDRIDAFGLVILASRSNTNRGMKLKSKAIKKMTKQPRYNPFNRQISSPFRR